jgi:hypothetical protein
MNYRFYLSYSKLTEGLAEIRLIRERVIHLEFQEYLF